MKRTRQAVEQIKSRKRTSNEENVFEPFSGNDDTISTGSTLLDLAISGGRFKKGGIPGGILVEAFGPSTSGKTVLLCEIAGAVQRNGGSINFQDPEGRLNTEFASIFGATINDKDYSMPNTVIDAFRPIREWDSEKRDPNKLHGVFADSLAALSTDMEMDDKDAYGMKRAKDFSQQCRIMCRVLKENNILMVCSNQVRDNVGGGPFSPKDRATGGRAIEFYSSLRLQFGYPKKIKRKIKVSGKDLEKIVGVETEVTVVKSTVWEPYHTAPFAILFDYGIDDIRMNLMYLKKMSNSKVYSIGKDALHNSLEQAIAIVEKEKLEGALKKEVIETWNLIEDKFKVDRMKKRRV